MSSRRTLITAGLCALLLPAAHAHGGKSGASRAVHVRKEQKEWGIAGDAGAVSRTIEIAMTDDMRFTPDRIEVRQGEVVKFIVANKGRMLHEMVLGTKQELDSHAAMMLKFPDMEHDEPYMTHLKPGARGQLIWNFNRPGDFEFACLIPGHYQGGMVGKIKVLPTPKQPARQEATP
jgi:uncharacterized cupredoxin-like copper-binding protein